MYQPNVLEAVADFHKTFNHPVLDSPQIPDPKRSALRVSLIAEELKELQEGIANGNIVEVADALADIQYVLAGAILEFGLGDSFGALFDEVQRSNMSKQCETMAVAEATVAHYAAQGVEGYIVPTSDFKFQVFRKADNKLLKSVNYSPADLKSIVVFNIEFNSSEFDVVSNLLGKTFEEANNLFKATPLYVSPDSINGVAYYKPTNLDQRRLNVDIVDGKIVRYNGNG